VWEIAIRDLAVLVRPARRLRKAVDYRRLPGHLHRPFPIGSCCISSRMRHRASSASDNPTRSIGSSNGYRRVVAGNGKPALCGPIDRCGDFGNLFCVGYPTLTSLSSGDTLLGQVEFALCHRAEALDRLTAREVKNGRGLGRTKNVSLQLPAETPHRYRSFQGCRQRSLTAHSDPTLLTAVSTTVFFLICPPSCSHLF
jgi:hypothetical protein